MHEKEAIATIALIVSVACGAPPESESPDPTENTSATAVNPVPEILPEVIARINDTEISRTEFERAIRSAEIQAGQVVPPQFRDQVYRQVLDRLIDFHLLLQEATARELVVDDAEIDAELARIKAEFSSEDEFEENLREWQTSPEALRAEMHKDLLIAKVIEREIVPQLSLSEDFVRDFYDQHGDQFREAETVRASHILISASQGADESSRAEALAQANALRAEVVETGVDFAALAHEHSADAATATNGGDLGFVERGQTVPAFEEALFGLEAGTISEVVESPFGFHVIKAVERRAGRIVPFEEASGQIRMLLIEQERQALTAEFISRLRTASTMEIRI